MRLQLSAQNIKEWLGIKLGLIPAPLAWSHFGFMASKFLLEAVDKGIFEAIGNNACTIDEIAGKCRFNRSAVHSLAGVLATMKLIKEKQGRLLLTLPAKKWLLKESAHSLYWLMIFDNRVCMKWMEHAGSYLQTGKGLQYHDTFTKEEWFYYQKAMEAVAKTVSKEAAAKIPIPANATQMLDIGGAHGLYSVALCKKYPSLSSTIIDLPAAVEHGYDILQQHNSGRPIHYQPGNVLTDYLGENIYDFILIASVAHHFTEEENKLVVQKAYKALKAGGVLSIMEVLRRDKIVYNGDMLSSFSDLFFALSSTSGAWSFQEISNWQTAAGFRYFKKSTFISIPGYVAISVIK